MSQTFKDNGEMNEKDTLRSCFKHEHGIKSEYSS